MENGTFTVNWKIWPSCRKRKNINANWVLLKFNIEFNCMRQTIITKTREFKHVDLFTVYSVHFVKGKSSLKYAFFIKSRKRQL